MKLWKYNSHKEYKEEQINGYRMKEGNSWVDVSVIMNIIAPYISDYNPEVSFGLCHGTRRGNEQQAFIDGFNFPYRKDVTVTGTELAPEASEKFPNTIEWDFHNVKDEWVGNVDFIYSNSFDHSYKPEECLDVWMSCLNKKGICILEWTEWHGEQGQNKLDPFGASLEEYVEMIEKKYSIVDTLRQNDRCYLVIKNKEKS